MTFIDDYSRFTWIYFLRTKAEVLTVFRSFVAYIETQFSKPIKVLRSDNGGEYMSHDFQVFLQQRGIISQRSCPYTPQQNGMAERKNRHLLDMVRTLLLEASVPPRFWVDTLSTAIYLINRLPSQQLNLILLTFAFLVCNLIIICCTLLDVFAFYTCLHMNVTSLQLNQ